MPLLSSFKIAKKNSRVNGYFLYGKQDATKFSLANPALLEKVDSSHAEPPAESVSKDQDKACGISIDTGDPVEHQRVQSGNSAHVISDVRLEYNPGLERLLCLAVFAGDSSGISKVRLAQILSQLNFVFQSSFF